MPLARIITSTPSSAHEVAAALNESGYVVEIVSPANIPATPADLEIDLDLRDTVKPFADPSPDMGVIKPVHVAETERVVEVVRPREAFNSFQPPAFNTDDARSSEGEEYGPIEREFVLAPLWRKFTSHLRESWVAVRPRRVSTSQERLHTHIEVQPVQVEELQDIPREASQPEFAAAGEEPHVFNTAIAAIQERLAAFRQQSVLRLEDANAFLSRTNTRLRTSASERSMRLRDQVTRWKLAYADRANHSKAARATHIPDAPLSMTARKSERRGRYLTHQLWPVAAGVAMAFVLGWVAATFNKLPVPQPASVSNVVAAKPAAKFVNQKSPAVRARQQSRSTLAAARKPEIRRRSRNSERNTFAEDEVVVHRYPSRTVTAQNRQQQQTKRFSDLQ